MGDFGPAQESFERIQNRHGLELFVKIIEPPNVRGNAYLVHGLTDVHDTPHMRALTSAFTQRGYRVVVWDSSHSSGRSEGSSDRATFYFHHEDLEDVIAWSSGQTWYAEPFMMAGFSLGGVAAGTFAASHPRQVEGLALVSSVVSGARVRRRIPAPFRGLWRLRKVMTVPPYNNRLSYELIRSGWAYNLLASAHRLVMPVLIVGAGRDFVTPPRALRRLRQAIGDNARLHLVRGARHGFDTPEEMQTLATVVGAWLEQR
jgi:alpha-beta hydrolase superfamily lysophospholipase